MGIARGLLALLAQSERSLGFYSGSTFSHRYLKDIVDQMDVQIMLRVPHDVLKQRRRERNDLEGESFLSMSFLRILLHKFNYLSLSNLLIL